MQRTRGKEEAAYAGRSSATTRGGWSWRLLVGAAALALAGGLVACGEDADGSGEPDAFDPGDASFEPDAADAATADARADGMDDGGDDASTAPDAPWPERPALPPSTAGGDRPAAITRPADYTPDRAWPLVVLLHGFGASGAVQSAYLGLNRLVDAQGFVLATPDGTVNGGGQRFWNATPACCAFGASNVDDVAYLRGLIEEIGETHRIDPARVYLLGHSNGGFMSYRMACEASDLVTAIVSLAGATFAPGDACAPATRPVSVLQVHGTEDETIAYEGGNVAGIAGLVHPSAEASVQRHAAIAGCDPDAGVAGEDRDLEAGTAGAETRVTTWSAGCAPGTEFALWSIEGGSHLPNLSRGGSAQMVEWLLAQRPPERDAR